MISVHRAAKWVAPSILLVGALCVFVAPSAGAQAKARRPLTAADIGDIATLEMLEDRRQFDSTELARLLASSHPEVRRRAAISIGRIANKRGIALLRAKPLDVDTAVAASVVFAVGQLRDSTTVGWMDSLLGNPRTNPAVAGEAAIALGKIKTAGARATLARFLAKGVVGQRNTPALREALLSIGRSTARGDITPIVRWTRSPNEEVRWRATWSLFRPRDPSAVTSLLAMSRDRSPIVRSWAVRGLTQSQADSAGVAPMAEKRLLIAIGDTDRRVRTEAIRALATYSDSAAIAALIAGTHSPDAWISVSAAEGLGRVRAPSTIPQLLASTKSATSCAVRVTAMNALQAFSPGDAQAAAIALTRDSIPYCRVQAAQLLTRTITGPNATALSTSGRATIESALDAFRNARRADLRSTDDLVRVAAVRAMGTLGDTTDLEAIAALRAATDSLSALGVTAASATVAIQRRAAIAAAGGQSPASAGRGNGRGSPPTRSLDEYRQIVERWIVPDYNGAPRPTAAWETPRGTIVLELFPGDAPLATDDFVRTMNAGTMIGTEFTRVVPDFVDQQQTIRGGNTLRDEVNRHGLTRGNLAWATAGLDTGSPGYTLGHTPQPHNEGDFTSLGRVIDGLGAMDRIELGDRILAARMISATVRH
jgi:HEAT repeat protein/cyclophilin family peptidyl-prolyl cis-trans isomerase